MKRKYRRVGFTATQSAELWERWKKGEGLKSIGRVFGKPSSCIFAHIRPSGGIMPPVRRRSRLALTLAEREEISRGLAAGRSVRSMAFALGRSPSTVSREIGRNGGSRRYRAEAADSRAWRQALRLKPCKLAAHDHLRQAVAAKLEMDWSPEQIAGWLKRTHPGNEVCQVSHETIYRSAPRHATQKADQRGRIPNAVSISERPASVEDRAVPGHWEGDLLCGSKNSFIVSLVERHSRYVMLAKIPNRDTQTVVNALIRQARKLPDELYKSLTWDRGKELADHKRFTMETDIDVYFCDPQSPWQRGSNENTNRLLRQYFPRGTDLAPHSQAQLNTVARQLNERPRKTLDFHSPAERFNDCVASTD